jgi:hypothetical protein
VNILSSALFVAITTISSSAWCTEDFGIPLVTPDDVVSRSIQPFQQYLEDLKHSSVYTQEGALLVYEPDAITECTTHRFVLKTGHEKVGDKLIETVSVFGCAQRIGTVTLERSGKSLVETPDEKLLAFQLPAPSESESYRLRVSWRSLDIQSKKTDSGINCSIAFELYGYQFKYRIAQDKNEQPNADTLRYAFDVQGASSGVSETGAVIAVRKHPAGYAQSNYYFFDDQGARVGVAMKEFKKIYQQGIESSLVGTLRSGFSFVPAGFP